MNYQDFIASKQRKIKPMGFDVPLKTLNRKMFAWQKQITHWALRRGRAAIFAECGLGKSLLQLSWSEHVHNHTGGSVIIHCPLGVRQQTLHEAAKFKIKCPIAVVNDQSEVINGINLVNYEKLHNFDATTFAGVVLDESSILKAMQGKTKRLLCDSYSQTPYRLACTATPAPNDHDELGSHAEFLGVSEAVDMRNRFFYHDSGDTGKWTLMPHARKEFWAWVAQWAVCVGKPSDINGDDTGYDLPPLNIVRHTVESDEDATLDGFLFNMSGISATTLHEEKRLTNTARCRKAAEIVASGSGPCLVWCDTNYEADELKRLMPQAIEIRGSDNEAVRERKMAEFMKGDAILITKPSVYGFGVNLQFCSRMVFAGLNYSFEAFYQSVRRCWRFGQEKQVDCHIVLADTESAISGAIARKESDFAIMRTGMAEAMREATLKEFGLDSGKVAYRPTVEFELPKFMQGVTNAS